MNIPEITRQFNYLTAIELFLLLAGLILFSFWLLKTSLGRKSLLNSLPRPNNMPVYTPFIPLFIWYGAVSTAIIIAEQLLPEMPDWQSTLMNSLLLSIGGIAAVTVMLILAKMYFLDRLKGFGLNFKTIHKDFAAALLNLLTIWPLVLMTIALTIYAGQIIKGQNFEIAQHEELKSITENPQLSVRILIVIIAVFIAPVFEEMLFRGFFQTMFRSYFAKHSTDENKSATSKGAWLAIIATSFLFAMIHVNAGHWPALFVLSICMGYSYEKSGSLFRPIFIHALFNATSVIAALNQ